MKVAVYICRCGGNVSEKLDAETLRSLVTGCVHDHEVTLNEYDFPCSEDGQAAIVEDLRQRSPDRVVFAACSPREHEHTFRGVMRRAGMNPYFMQMTNIREHVTWVSEDVQTATAKAALYIRAAVARVALHEALEPTYLDVDLQTLVIGAGPAGMRATLALLEAGRKVVLVERAPLLGGMPVLYEEIAPTMECGPCLLEPALGEVLSGPHAKDVELLTQSEVTKVVGYHGNFTVTITRKPRFVDTRLCIGCGDCTPACPAEGRDSYNQGLGQRKAIAVPFPGALPNVPYLDPELCLRSTQANGCELCREACPVEGAIRYDDEATVIERKAGAIVVAVGSRLYDLAKLPKLGHGAVSGVMTSLEFERLLASNGPTEGALLFGGQAPRSVAIIHCVGSLDPNHRPYCSQVCCVSAFKYNALIAKKTPSAEVVHYVKTICVPGKQEYKLYERAKNRAEVSFVQYQDLAELTIEAGTHGGPRVRHRESERDFDLVILMPAIVPGDGTAKLASLLDLSRDEHGFFEELNGALDNMKAKVKGVYVVGTCQAPMDIARTTSQASAASGHILASLVEGRKLEIDPVSAVVDPARCSGCKSCLPVCPYRAITFQPERNQASINALLCSGCGTCVATCPSAAISGRHFTSAQIRAELAEVLG